MAEAGGARKYKPSFTWSKSAPADGDKFAIWPGKGESVDRLIIAMDEAPDGGASQYAFYLVDLTEPEDPWVEIDTLVIPDGSHGTEGVAFAFPLTQVPLGMGIAVIAEATNDETGVSIRLFKS